MALFTYAVTGDVRNTAIETPVAGPTMTAPTRPTIDNSGFGGALTAGSLQYQVSPSARFLISWKDGEVITAQWSFASAALRNTALEAILANMDSDAVSISASGVATVLAPAA